MTQPKWKRGDLVRTTARLMFGAVVIPQGTEIRIQGAEPFFDIQQQRGEKDEPLFDETFAYEGNAILTTGLHLCYPLWVEDLEEVT